MEPAAAVLGITLQSLPIRNGEEIDAGFGAAFQANAQAVVTMDDPLICPTVCVSSRLLRNTTCLSSANSGCCLPPR